MAVKVVVVASLLLVAEGALACATCTGPADAPQTLGMNAAILTLFGVLSVVGLTIAVFVGLIARRIARHSAEQPSVEIPAIGTGSHLGCERKITMPSLGQAADDDEDRVRLRHAPCVLCRAGMPNPLSSAPTVSEH